ncbi:WhiB family transcriptional regulator [Streptomyces ossamyceticus]|uniref:WhiB family transcriptional regulator n=1 Tax=Streptomyces ossamyceticus TaxID=249581 RepID=UPI0039C9B757
MSNYTGAAPDTAVRPADWLAGAPCKADPEAMFPANLDHEIDKAKAYCRICPAVERCLQWALDTGQEWGVWGGLSERERRRLRRRAVRPISIDDYTNTPTEAPGPRTLEQAWDEFAHPDGDHTLWTGPKVIRHLDGNITPNRIAFRLDRKREPEGIVTRTCEMEACVRPSHLEDNTERQRCGTRPGYDRHRRYGEPACEACRQANAAADTRRRSTAVKAA